MTREEYITLFEKKTGETYELPEGFKEVFLSNRGFCQYAKCEEEQAILVLNCCGDGEFWRDYGALLAKEHGYHKLISKFCRPARAYIRAMHFSIERCGANDDGREWFVCKDGENLVIIQELGDSVNTGKKTYLLTKGV